MRGCLIFCF